MKINVDYSIVEDFLELVKSEDFTDHQAQQFVEQVSNRSSFKKMLGFYNGVFNQDEYFNVLFKAIKGIDLCKDEEHLQTLYSNLCRLRDTSLLENKLNLIKNYNFTKLVQELGATCPKIQR